MTDILPFLKTADMATREQLLALSKEAEAEIDRLRTAFKGVHDNAEHVDRSLIRGAARDALQEVGL
jgi:hypothetical protein